MKIPQLPQSTAKAIKEFMLRTAFLLTSAAIFLLLVYYIPRNTRYEYTDAKTSSSSEKNVNSEKSELCTLILQNGNLVVYSADGKRTVTDARTDSLTEYDIQLLSEGIHATEEEIYELLGTIES